MARSNRFISPALLALGLTVASACQGDLTLPDDGGPSILRVVSGDGQKGIVGSELQHPLKVQLTDGAARPLPGVALRFEPKAGGPQVQSAVDSTDDSGYAETRVRLGDTEGTQTVEASLADAASDLKTSFALIAESAPPDDQDGENDGGGEVGEDDDDGNGGRGRGRGRGRGNGNNDKDDDEEDDD
jgi:hypothetical protein